MANQRTANGESADSAPRFLFGVSRVALLVVFLLGFALRVHRLAAQSLWYDEAVTAHVASQGLAELTRWTADDIQPPLYYYAVAGWTRLAGHDEWALRFPSAFFSILTVALMWALARRLFDCGRGDSRAAFIAVLLAALSPLYVYYAQEARMYAQLTFLGALAGYALLRAMGGSLTVSSHTREPELKSVPLSFVLRLLMARWWLVFVLAAVAALYTHYFAAFLLLAYGVCVSLVCGRGMLQRAPRAAALQRLAAFAIAAAAIVAAYLPWLPAMLTRYRVDRSYWQGTLKLDEALRHVAISFAVGAPETLREADALRLLPWFGVALAAAAVALVWRGGRGQRMETDHRIDSRAALVYLSVCLLVSLLAVLALASRTPKFNARYLMLASPAYLLLLAGGLGVWAADCRLRIADCRLRTACPAVSGIADCSPARRVVSRLTFHVSRLALFAALLAFLLLTSFVGLRNWFTDPAFTKAQWRELVSVVRAARTADEAVVLVSGHAWPVWDYYAPDIPCLRLPDRDILDVEAALGFDAAPILGQALAGKSGVWLVRWQADAVDPVGFALYFLDRAGAGIPVTRQFWHLDLRHWRLQPAATFSSEPQPAHATGVNYDHKLALLGWDDPANRQIILYWRGLNQLERDYKLSLILEDATGREVGRWDGRPAGYDYPTLRWRSGQALFGRYPLPLPTGAPGGDYTLTVAVYDDADPSGLDIRDVADNPAGKRARLGPVNVRP